jgi:hypothetical protein
MARSRLSWAAIGCIIASLIAVGLGIWVIVLYANEANESNNCNDTLTNGNGNGNNCPPPLPAPPVYPGCLPATCESRGSISLNGAFLSTDGVSVLNSQGRCCQWDPRQSGQGQARAPLTVAVPMQTTDDLGVVTTDTTLTINVQLSGGDLAIRACLPAFTFSLFASTPDANGLLGLGGFFWSGADVTYIPSNYAPASANYTALPLQFTPVAGRPPIFANFFNDGSVRLTGRNGISIPAGTYNVKAACIIYNSRRNPAPPPLNVLISDASCVSTIATATPQNNRQTWGGNYYEYFGVDYYNGVGYIATRENCYPGSNNGSQWFQGAMLTSFYKVKRTGAGLVRQTYTPTLDGSLAPDAFAILRPEFRTIPTHPFEIGTTQQEPGITVSRLNPNNLMIGVYSADMSITRGGFQTMFSTDGGVTWDTQSANFASDIGIPGALLVPYPQLFYNQSWNCSNYSGSWECPPLDTDLTYTLGWEYDTRSGLYPVGAGDTRVTTDAFDVFWRVGLYSRGEYTFGSADVTVGYSLDYGQNWFLAGDMTSANGTAFSYDFNVVAAGPDGKGGSQFCVAIKVDANIDELIAYGTILPVELNCFHTTKRGIVDSIDRISIPGSEPGHYGGMAIGKEGTIYYVMQGMTITATDPSTGEVLGTGQGPYGSNELSNAPIFFTTCTPSPGVVCKRTTVIARSDYGYVCPNVQSFRCTWSQPNVLVDKNNNIYVIFTGVIRNPLPDANAFFSFVNTYQQTRILMTKSCDGGQTWAPPQAINDDTTVMGDSFSTPNVHFNTQPQYDPITNTILISWIDTRVDPVDLTGSQVYAAVVTL